MRLPLGAAAGVKPTHLASQQAESPGSARPSMPHTLGRPPRLTGSQHVCPTSSPTTWPALSDKHLRHYRDFVETGIRLAPYD